MKSTSMYPDGVNRLVITSPIVEEREDRLRNAICLDPLNKEGPWQTECVRGVVTAKADRFCGQTEHYEAARATLMHQVLQNPSRQEDWIVLELLQALQGSNRRREMYLRNV